MKITINIKYHWKDLNESRWKWFKSAKWKWYNHKSTKIEVLIISGGWQYLFKSDNVTQDVSAYVLFGYLLFLGILSLHVIWLSLISGNTDSAIYFLSLISGNIDFAIYFSLIEKFYLQSFGRFLSFFVPVLEQVGGVGLGWLAVFAKVIIFELSFCFEKECFNVLNFVIKAVYDVIDFVPNRDLCWSNPFLVLKGNSSLWRA